MLERRLTPSVPPLFDNRAVRRNAMRARPDALDFLASEVALELDTRLGLIARSFHNTLILGPLADRIANRFPALGASVCEGRDVTLSGSSLPFEDGTFDCVLSLCALQSVNDIRGSLAEANRVLRGDGLFMGSLFAGDTLCELRRAWLAAESALRGGASPRVAPFAHLGDLSGLLQQAGFALPVADIDRIPVTWGHALALMREIKALGFANALTERSRGLVSPALLAMAAGRYPGNKRISATIEMAWLTAWHPDASQPKPLKPGSARARLADALNVPENKL